VDDNADYGFFLKTDYSSGSLATLGLRNSTDTDILTLKNGKVGIGRTDPTQTLDVAGSLALLSGAAVNEFSTDGTLADNSDAKVPTQKAAKTYADTMDATRYTAATNAAWIAFTNALAGGELATINVAPAGNYQVGGTNLVQWREDTLNGTGGVYFASSGTNYWLLRW
jgi:hypothetical protein